MDDLIYLCGAISAICIILAVGGFIADRMKLKEECKRFDLCVKFLIDKQKYEEWAEQERVTISAYDNARIVANDNIIQEEEDD